MDDEMLALAKNETWNLVEKSKGANILENRWVYKLKYTPDVSIDRYKARLVVKGCQQKPGVDFGETYSPVAKMGSIKMCLALMAAGKMAAKQFDVKTAFLYGRLKEEVFMQQPEGYSDGTDRVCKLNRSLYGLRQSPRCWNEKFNNCLRKFNLKAMLTDPCVFTSSSRDLILVVHVDDGLVISRDPRKIDKLMSNLSKELEIKVNTLNMFLGIQIEKLNDGEILAHQKLYTRKLLERFKVEDANPVAIPADNHQDLSQHVKPEGQGETINAPYREAVGSLLFLAIMTRPDISYAVNVVSQFCSNPQKIRWNAVKRILKYLKGTTGHGIRLAAGGDMTQITAFSDADYAGDSETRRST